MADENQLQDLRDKGRNEYGIQNADQMSEEQLRAEIQAIDDQPKSAESADQAETDEDDESEPDLDGMSRAELEAHAKTLGIEHSNDRTEYPNKGALIEAIEDAQANAEDEDDE